MHRSPFPTVRRVGKIRRTVEVLSDRTGKGGNQYWKQVIAGMRTQMVSAGLFHECNSRHWKANRFHAAPLVSG
ncbi:DUF6074 family protein [Mesorhizobium sp.]|uniref:DUF6074 family protein n=1 Tax=Mesorhizobium sp. TaxID=1871066 RepID=UPI00339004FF